MRRYMKGSLGIALLGAVALGVQACDSFLEVDNPNNLETEQVVPERDARLLSQSVYQRFVSGISEFAVYIAWFTNRARVGDTFPTRNDFGRREIPNNNGHINTFWNVLHESINFARSNVLNTEAAGPTVDLARNWFVSAWAILLQAELFCEGTLAQAAPTPLGRVPRGPMTSLELLDSAIVDFEMVQDIAAQVTGADASTAASLSMAAQVGIARAHLQAGRRAEAAAAAALVPANFVYNMIHIDNSSQRALGNQIWSFSEARISLVVGPEFRAMADSSDPRIAYVDMGRLAQDGELRFYRQNKYTGWASSVRLASGLEAQYIATEAGQDAAAILAFIQARRAAGNQPAFPTTTNMDSLMTELMVQKARDFWLEGKDVADFRRNPDNAPYVLATGPNYYKPSLGPVSDQTCWPVPRNEIDNNPNW